MNIVDKTKVEIIEHRFSGHAHRTVKFQELPKHVCDRRIDLLWELSFNFKRATPNWQGMMHTVHRGSEHPGQSSVLYLPIIDMYSGDKTCILSTLEFLSNLAMKHHVVPIITFDQPLYWKAAELIINSPNNNLKEIVSMLSCFHTFMNLLGAIGTLMKGTGLQRILEVVYGESTVVHMMTGKSVQRSFRGHLLVDKCLNYMIVSYMVKLNPKLAELVDKSEEMYYSLLAGEMTLESILTSDTVTTIKLELDQMKAKLYNRSKTSQLWINYQKMLQIAHTECKDLYFRSDKAKTTKVYDINRLKLILGDHLCSQLLFVHAITGCDTTSRIFGVGKKAAFQKLVKGDQLLPTASSTKFHCQRVYYQIMVWTEQGGNMDAANWGWRVEENVLVPIMSETNVAPDNLLKMIHCNCTTGCTTLRCSCRRYGLPCHTVCGQCQVELCSNPYNQHDSEDDDD